MTTEPLAFYAGSGSPFAWKIWMALEFKGIPYTLHMLSFSAGDTRAPAFRAITPRGKVPAIVHDGAAIWESAAILEYLEDRFPEGRLWPTAPLERARARRLAAENDLYVYPQVRRIMSEALYKPLAAINAQELGAARTELRSELSRLAGELRGEFFAGALSAADFALYPSLASLGRVQARVPALGVLADVPPALRDYMDRMAALPLVQTTWPPHWRA